MKPLTSVSGQNNQPADILTADAVRDRLTAPVDVRCYRTLDSTNTEAGRLLRQHPNNYLVIAEEQTAGRGRQGKTFYSPAGTGIYFSLALCAEKTAADWLGVTSAAAVAVCRAIETLTDRHPRIKWVNDIYLNDRKIAGILTETVANKSGKVFAVIIGIGVNLFTQAFPPDIPDAGSLHTPVGRAALIAAVADELYLLAGQPCSAFIDAYRRRSLLTTGRRIIYRQNDTPHAATVLGIDEQCGLTVQPDTGAAVTLRSGEISIRKE